MDLIWEVYGIEKPVTEFRFHPERRWRFDYAWPKWKIALEVEGAIWTRGRHVRGKGYLQDLSKYNAAIALGWKVLRFSTEEFKSGKAQDYMKKVFELYAR